jgi:hypothetical protein
MTTIGFGDYTPGQDNNTMTVGYAILHLGSIFVGQILWAMWFYYVQQQIQYAGILLRRCWIKARQRYNEGKRPTRNVSSRRSKHKQQSGNRMPRSISEVGVFKSNTAIVGKAMTCAKS